MKLETKRTLYLTKAEKKVLEDFYWNFYTDDTVDDMYDVLKALARDSSPWDCSYKIEITD